jgi:DNA-binding CsgD family transcriptional regulator
VRLGILDERGGRLEFHPLTAAFFERQVGLHAIAAPDAVSQASAHYRGRGELDAAFDLTNRLGGPEDVDRLVSESMAQLLDTARLPTLKLWASHAATRVGESTTVLLARAEVALRQGRHLTAQSLVERVPSSENRPTVYRANLLGGRAAHVGSREQDALILYRRAEEAASDDDERRGAKWGQLTAAIDLELASSLPLLRELQSSSETLNPTEVIQAADKSLAYGLRFGAVESLAEAKRVAELLPSVPDPFLRSSFGSTFSCALNLAAEYNHALEVSTEMIRDAKEFRVEFALPYGLLARASALAGLRQFEESRDCLASALAHAVRCSDLWAQQSVYAARIRALLQEARISEACALEPPAIDESLPAIRGEVWGSRGLALACMGRLSEARECENEIRGSTRAVEATVLGICINAVVAIKGRDNDLRSALRRLVTDAFSAGAVDYVVTCYRANPDLLAALLRDSETAEATGYIVARAGDHAVVDAIGLDAIAAIDPVSTLSRREREVYDLLCEGLPNTEIAQRLFISHATVKVHVRHVYDKLGIRSRTAVALSAASRRAQANPTAVTGDDGTSSDVDG